MQDGGGSWIYGRRWLPIRSGWGCFSKTHWHPVDEYYRTRDSRMNRSFFRLMGIMPVLQEPRIDYAVFDPWDPYWYGGGCRLPLPVPRGGGDWGSWRPWDMTDPTIAADLEGWMEWRAQRHREEVARIDGDIAEMSNWHPVYYDDVLEGGLQRRNQVGGGPDRGRIHQLRRELADMEQQMDRYELRGDRRGRFDRW